MAWVLRMGGWESALGAPDARECAGCSGTGVLALRFTNPELRGVVCRCGGSGWLTPEDAGMQQKDTPPTD